MFVSTVASFFCFIIKLLGAGEQKPKRECFRYYCVSKATIISGAFSARQILWFSHAKKDVCSLALPSRSVYLYRE